MIVCKDIKVVFIAVPKTGTRTVYDVLKKNFDTIQLEDHRTDVPNEYKDYFTFTIKRNPYERFVSIWWSTTNRETIKRKLLQHLMGNDKSIKKFCEIFPKLYNTEPIFRQQISYSNNKIDTVLDFNNLEKEFLNLDFMKKAGIHSIPKLNVTDGNKKDDRQTRIYRNDWKQYVDKNVENLVLKYYAEDFKYFNY